MPPRPAPCGKGARYGRGCGNPRSSKRLWSGRRMLKAVWSPVSAMNSEDCTGRSSTAGRICAGSRAAEKTAIRDGCARDGHDKHPSPSRRARRRYRHVPAISQCGTRRRSRLRRWERLVGGPLIGGPIGAALVTGGGNLAARQAQKLTQRRADMARAIAARGETPTKASLAEMTAATMK